MPLAISGSTMRHSGTCCIELRDHAEYIRVPMSECRLYIGHRYLNCFIEIHRMQGVHRPVLLLHYHIDRFINGGGQDKTHIVIEVLAELLEAGVEVADVGRAADDPLALDLRTQRRRQHFDIQPGPRQRIGVERTPDCDRVGFVVQRACGMQQAGQPDLLL